MSVATAATEEDMRFDTVKKVCTVVAGNHYCSKYILQGLTRAVWEPTGCTELSACVRAV